MILRIFLLLMAISIAAPTGPNESDSEPYTGPADPLEVSHNSSTGFAASLTPVPKSKPSAVCVVTGSQPSPLNLLEALEKLSANPIDDAGYNTHRTEDEVVNSILTEAFTGLAKLHRQNRAGEWEKEAPSIQISGRSDFSQGAKIRKLFGMYSNVLEANQYNPFWSQERNLFKLHYLIHLKLFLATTGRDDLAMKIWLHIAAHCIDESNFKGLSILRSTMIFHKVVDDDEKHHHLAPVKDILNSEPAENPLKKFFSFPKKQEDPHHSHAQTSLKRFLKVLKTLVSSEQDLAYELLSQEHIAFAPDNLEDRMLTASLIRFKLMKLLENAESADPETVLKEFNVDATYEVKGLEELSKDTINEVRQALFDELKEDSNELSVDGLKAKYLGKEEDQDGALEELSGYLQRMDSACLNLIHPIQTSQAIMEENRTGLLISSISGAAFTVGILAISVALAVTTVLNSSSIANTVTSSTFIQHGEAHLINTALERVVASGIVEELAQTAVQTAVNAIRDDPQVKETINGLSEDAATVMIAKSAQAMTADSALMAAIDQVTAKASQVLIADSAKAITDDPALVIAIDGVIGKALTALVAKLKENS
jgi:hypothetical protein